MEFKKRLLEIIRAIDFTLLGKALLSGASTVARFLGGLMLRAVEKILDRKLGDAIDNVDVEIKDQAIEKDREAKAQAVKEAKTDDEIDEAFRNSLK